MTERPTRAAIILVATAALYVVAFAGARHEVARDVFVWAPFQRAYFDTMVISRSRVFFTLVATLAYGLLLGRLATRFRARGARAAVLAIALSTGGLFFASWPLLSWSPDMGLSGIEELTQIGRTIDLLGLTFLQRAATAALLQASLLWTFIETAWAAKGAGVRTRDA